MPPPRIAAPLPFLALLVLPLSLARAQVGVGTATPHASAALDITAADKGLLIPRLDSTQRAQIANPPDGLMVFQKDGRVGLWYAFGGGWVFIPDKLRAGDNLGSHTATRNLNLQTNALTGTGDLLVGGAGLGIRADGGLNVGQSNLTLLIGFNAGRVNNAYLNHMVGINAGYHNSTGRYNMFEGSNAGFSNTTASYNMFMGFESGYHNTSGEYNMFTGLWSGYNNTTGDNNYFSGQGSGYSNTTGRYNTHVGNWSGPNSGTGSYNVFLGHSAGNSNRAGSGNTYVGYLADGTTNGLQNAAAIGYYAQVSQSNSLVLGGTGSNAVNVGIGTTAPSQRLEVVGNVRIAGTGNGLRFADGTQQTTAASDAQALGLSGQTLSLTNGGSVTLPDGLGDHQATQALNLRSQTLTGTGADLGTAVGLGVRADGGLNIGQNTPGSHVPSSNVSIGYLTGSPTGIRNQLVGVRSGAQVSSGSFNTFSGYESGSSVSTSSYNTFSGYESGQTITTGGGNTFMGAGSGVDAAAESTDNTALGYEASIQGSLTNATAIGARARVGQSHSMALGGVGQYRVKVGIGTGAPQAHLHVGADGDALIEGRTGLGTQVTSTGSARLYVRGTDNLATSNVAEFYNSPQILGVAVWYGGMRRIVTPFSANGNLALDAGGAGHVLLNANGGTGNVGIGTAAPAATLHVAGATSSVRLGGLAGTGTRVVTATATGDLATGSTLLNRLAGGQAGTATLGAGAAGVNVYTVTFPAAFAAAPGQVLLTVRAATGQTYTDTFAATTKTITATGFQVNVTRADGAGQWGQNLLLDWIAVP